MIRRLRLKFVCIVMAVVTLMLCAIFAMVFYFTSRNLERESLGMMQAVAQNPMRLGGPDELPEGVRLPYFVLELDETGAVVSSGGGYYDLTDEDLRERLGGTLVRLRRQGRGFCLLSVENSGVPLSPAQQRDIFKRFYRADGTRSGGSYGLGLRGLPAAVRGHLHDGLQPARGLLQL